MYFLQRIIERVSFCASVLIAAFSGIGYASSASANTIHVCSTCAHTSIQAAVSDAASGDTIDIAAGRYVENITISGKALTLIGQSAGSTFVYAAGRGPVFTLGSGTPADPSVLIVIRGITIAHGNHTGGTGVGGGVQVRAGAYLHLENSTLTENTATSGGAIGVDSPSAPATTISGCLIDGNSAPTVGFGGPGGGVLVATGSTVSIQQSIITRNTARNGGGVYGLPGSALIIAGSTINGNFAHAVATHFGLSGGGGGGVEAHGALNVESSYFTNNFADGEDGGGGLALYSDPAQNTIVSDTIIAQNTAGTGAGISGYGGGLSLQTSYVVQNNGIGIWGNIGLSNDRSTIKDNTQGDICVTDYCPH
jgi:hypothetical protein